MAKKTWGQTWGLTQEILRQLFLFFYFFFLFFLEHLLSHPAHKQSRISPLPRKDKVACFPDLKPEMMTSVLMKTRERLVVSFIKCVTHKSIVNCVHSPSIRVEVIWTSPGTWNAYFAKMGIALWLPLGFVCMRPCVVHCPPSKGFSSPYWDISVLQFWKTCNLHICVVLLWFCQNTHWRRASYPKRPCGKNKQFDGSAVLYFSSVISINIELNVGSKGLL